MKLNKMKLKYFPCIINKKIYNMKNQRIIIALMLMLAIASCNKDEEEDQQDTPTFNTDITQLNNGVTTGLYAPYTTGSTFDYRYIDMMGTQTNATWTVLEEKLIDDKYYIEIEGFLGAVDKGYFNCENGDYTIYLPASGQTPIISMIYMKEDVPVGTEWEESISVTVQGIEIENKYVFSYEGNLDSWEVEGETYTDVAHVHLKTYYVYMGVEQLASEDDYYWGEGVGLLEKTGLSGNISLLSYNIE